MTNDQLVEKYKAIYKSKTGKELSDQEALEQALKLVQLIEAVHPRYARKVGSYVWNKIAIGQLKSWVEKR